MPVPDTRKDLLTLQRHHLNVLETEENEQLPLESSADLAHEDAVQTVIEKRKLTLKQAERLLLKFRSMATFFPFVEIPPRATVPVLSRSSPFLLLAVLTVASIDDLFLHRQIEHEFRRVLSTKILLQGQKSLDFLQGMLIYIAWQVSRPSFVDVENLF